MFQFLGVVVGSCVLPVALAVTWHRVTGAGIVIGAVVGFAVAFIAWLAYASTFDGGLELFRINTGGLLLLTIMEEKMTKTMG